jgi:hypothetical protein
MFVKRQAMRNIYALARQPVREHGAGRVDSRVFYATSGKEPGSLSGSCWE